MKRPKTSSTKTSWFGIVSVFMLAIALVAGVVSTTQAATGSFDRDAYLPDLGTSDYDRAWISVTDSTANTSDSADTVTVTVKGPLQNVTFTLLETGTGTGIFTTTGLSQASTYPVGTTSGYVEDFGSGTHNFPALGSGVYALKLVGGIGNVSGDATVPKNGELKVASGNTIELLYGGSTLDTSVVKTNDGSITFNDSAITATDDPSTSENIQIIITDPDENLNPKGIDVIGFVDGAVAFSGSPGTGSSRVQIEALDQIDGTSRLSLGGTSILTQNIVLVETDANSGVFTANGKIYGTTTTVASTDLVGNVQVGSSTPTAVYTGQSITLGDTTNGPSVTFKILEVTSSGRLGLVEIGTSTTGAGEQALVFVSPSAALTTPWGSGTQSASVTNVAAYGTNNVRFGTTNSTRGSSTTGIVKLIEGSDYCLVAISSWLGTETTSAIGLGGTFETGNGGSVTVALGSFSLVGPRSGDKLQVSYLDELLGTGLSGTSTGTVDYGVTGETGSVAHDATSPDINDLVTITVVDGNLNASSSSQGSVAAGTSLWGGTTTNRRGDRLTIKNYTSNAISVSHPDGTGVGTQTVRVSSSDSTYVWMVPNSLTGTFQSPLSLGSTTFSLGTQSTSSVPLIRGSSSGATSFLSSATTSSFKATLDGQDNTVEISPDGTHWVSVPIVETGANSSTFTGTIGFDYTAARLTTDTTAANTDRITSFTGTSTLIFDGRYNPLSSFIGTGSVVRVYDGTTEEFAQVCSPGETTLSVTKLSQDTSFVPHRTWVQVIGNDMMAERLLSDVFRIGGICGGTYRVRYNDALKSGNEYAGGDTLAATASNFGFTTYEASLSTNVTGTVGPDTVVVVTLVDQDLNTSSSSAQTTFGPNSVSNISETNETGLGLPSGSSTGNLSTGYRDGGASKVIYASTLSDILSTSVTANNAIDFVLTESDANTGTFVGSFFLSSGTSTTNSSDLLKVSNGDSVYVFYNDSPSGSTCQTTSFTATDAINVQTGLGVITLSKDTAYLSGDTVVVTVVDADRNQNVSSQETLSGALAIAKNYTSGDSYTGSALSLVETAVNSGTFLATVKAGGVAATDSSSGNLATIGTEQGGNIRLTYTDTSPAGKVAETLNFSSDDATLAFDADSVGLGSYAVLTLTDAEKNASHTSEDTINTDVTIQTSSANSTTLRMTETGADTGTFKGSIQVVSSGGTLANTRIQASEGDTLTASYTDAINTTLTSLTVTDTASVSEATPTPSPTPVVSPTVTASPTPPTTPLPTLPPVTPLPTLPPITPLPTLPPITPLPTLPVPTPTVAPVCEAENIAVSPSSLRLKRKKSGDVTVTVTGAEGCAVEGEAVTATVRSSDKKEVKVKPKSATTDASGAATFTITAKKKTGTARITFKAGDVKKAITVRVRK